MALSNEPFSINNDTEAKSAADTVLENIKTAERMYQDDPMRATCMFYSAERQARNLHRYVSQRMRQLPDEVSNEQLDMLSCWDDAALHALSYLAQVDGGAFYNPQRHRA